MEIIVGLLIYSLAFVGLSIWIRNSQVRDEFKETFKSEPPKKKLAGVKDAQIDRKLGELALECRVAEQKVHNWDSRQNLEDFEARLEKRDEARKRLKEASNLAEQFGFAVDRAWLAGESIPYHHASLY